MPRPARGPYLSDKPNAHGCYEIHWNEPAAERGGKARSKRLSTGTGDVEKARRILAHFIIGKPATDALTDAEKMHKGEAPIGDLFIDYWQERCVKKNRGVADRIEANNRLATQFYNIKNLAAFFGQIDTDHWRLPDVERNLQELRGKGFTVVELSDELIEDYCEERCEEREISNWTLRRELGILVAILSHAQDKRRLSRDAVVKITLPDEPDGRDRWLTDKETHALLAAAQPPGKDRLTRAYRFIAVARYLAARKRSIETLSWHQIDMDAWRIRFNPRGRKQTKKKRPILPIPDVLKGVFQRAWEERTNDLWFLDHPGSVRGAFEGAVERAGLVPPQPWLAQDRKPTSDELRAWKEARVTPHVLRHTYATRAVQSGVPLLDAAHVLGDTIETFTKRYVHHCPDYLRDAVNAGLVDAPPELIERRKRKPKANQDEDQEAAE
jgi:integrase